MMMKFKSIGMLSVMVLALLLPPLAAAHCDTLGGPVIADARIALEKGDVTPVLKWVKAEDESTVRTLFQRTLKVRTQSPEARDLADTYFFESVVRIHRAGEGAPYTGLKPAEAAEPIIAATDTALDAGTPEKVTQMLQERLAEGVHDRFARALEAKKHAGDRVAAGREYVQAYVELTHHVEAVQAAVGGTGHHAAAGHARRGAPVTKVIAGHSNGR